MLIDQKITHIASIGSISDWFKPAAKAIIISAQIITSTKDSRLSYCNVTERQKLKHYSTQKSSIGSSPMLF